MTVEMAMVMVAMWWQLAVPLEFLLPLLLLRCPNRCLEQSPCKMNHVNRSNHVVISTINLANCPFWMSEVDACVRERERKWINIHSMDCCPQQFEFNIDFYCCLSLVVYYFRIKTSTVDGTTTPMGVCSAASAVAAAFSASGRWTCALLSLCLRCLSLLAHTFVLSIFLVGFECRRRRDAWEIFFLNTSAVFNEQYLKCWFALGLCCRTCIASG